MSDARPPLTRQLLVMIGLVIAVDAIAIAAWFLAGIRGRSESVQLFYAVIWTAVTFGVVMASVRKMREARRDVNSEQ